MINLTLFSALLLCSLSWLSGSGSESQTVEVQPGEEVTLTCSNISTVQTQTFWSRVIKASKISCISSTFGTDNEILFCDGNENGKFEMTSNVSTVSLKIKRVNLSDSGMYFCGFYINRHTMMNEIHLKVQGDDSPDDSHDDVDGKSEKQCSGITSLTVVLGGLTGSLILVIIGLVVKIRKLPTVEKEERSPQKQNLCSDDLNYAALHIHPNPKRSCRPASDKELEINVVYAATR
uniref:uncharacterized protein LOC124054513 n=1 Tax=Scatophagus argus TaxID=75038 RepID=UPI001ED81866|nr:uncharacterized protein LOC124054513 [Scatophagus argus]